jgi:hypothetical protein
MRSTNILPFPSDRYKNLEPIPDPDIAILRTFLPNESKLLSRIEEFIAGRTPWGEGSMNLLGEAKASLGEGTAEEFQSAYKRVYHRVWSHILKQREFELEQFENGESTLVLAERSALQARVNHARANLS